MKRHLPTPSCLTGLLGVILYFVPQAGLVTAELLDPTVTGNVELTGGSFVLTTNPFSLFTQQILSINLDKRSFLEFPLDTVSTGSDITAATLDLDVSVFTSSGSDFPIVPIFGYSGDGLASVGDATVTADILGVSDPITQTGHVLIDLDISFIAGLVDDGETHIGIMIMGDANGLQAGFENFNPLDTPMLNISFGTPGDFDLDGDVDGYDFLKWQRGESPDPLSASDLLDWENNYGTTAPLIAITSVPEPTTLCFVLLGALGLLANRQTCGYFSSRLTS